MTSKLKTDILETGSGSGTIALNNQLSGMTHESMPSGSVLQVVREYTPNESYASTTATSFVASGLSVIITPTAVGNTILIDCAIPMTDKGSGSNMRVAMYQNGSPMAGTSSYHAGYHTQRYMALAFGGKFVSVNTSPITFEIYFRSATNSTVYILHDDSSSQITATEIKG